MNAPRKIRWWMLIYTVGIALSFVFAAIGGAHKTPRPRPLVCEVLGNLAVILMFVGNLFYIFAYVRPRLQQLWKFVFPLIIGTFIAAGIFAYLDKSGRNYGVGALVFVWIVMIALFFPSFRANFLLGFGDVGHVTSTESPVVMSEEPLRDLVREMTKMRRMAQTGWIVAVSLLAVLVVNSYFQYHFEPKSDSWLTVVRLVQRGKYTEA